MGGLGSHHIHPYAVQTAAFLASLLLPGMAFALVGGAYWEKLSRRRAAPPPSRQGSIPVVLAAEWNAE